METPFWLAEPPPPIAANSSDRVDVAVIGAGITGCACALALARGGLRVGVHDARGIAEGASGRNGGFALRGGAARYDVARETYGADAARELWTRTEAALERLELLADDAFRRTGSLRLAADVEERVEIRAEYEALREDGFSAEWHDELSHLRPDFRGAIFHPRDGALQPARFVHKLAGLAAEAGVAFHEHDRVAALEDLEADQIVIATDGSGRGLLTELDDALWPARGQVLATEPLGDRLFDCPHYARQGFETACGSRPAIRVTAMCSVSCAESSWPQRCRDRRTRFSSCSLPPDYCSSSRARPAGPRCGQIYELSGDPMRRRFPLLSTSANSRMPYSVSVGDIRRLPVTASDGTPICSQSRWSVSASRTRM